jgi:hypothetical protein
MSPQPARGKRRAEPSKWRPRRRETKPGGRRADRPENNEGITPEFLEQLREAEAEQEARPMPVRTGPGAREVLAGITADLRADQAYMQALSRLAYG